MKKVIKFILLLASVGEACAITPGPMVQRTLFSADVVSSACHVVVEAVGGLLSLSISGWQRSYYSPGGHDSNVGDKGGERGVTGALSTQMKSVNLNIGASSSRNSQGVNNWALSASVSVPFTLLERKYSSSTSISSSRGGGTGLSSGVSGSLSDRLSYGAGGGRDSDGGVSSYLNASYAGERAWVSGALNQSTSGGTGGSMSASGSLLGMPAAGGIVLSRTTGDTVALVSVKDTPGVKVTSAYGETDSGGNLVVALNSYDWNPVTVDAGTLPLNTELTSTSRKVVPSERAVVWMPFEALKVRRYLLQVKQKNGEFVAGGTWARDGKDTPLGFVANNGVLMINAVDVLGDITLGQCRITRSMLIMLVGISSASLPALAAHDKEKLMYLGVLNGQIQDNSVVKVTRTLPEPVLFRAESVDGLPDSLIVRNAESRPASAGAAWLTVKQRLPGDGKEARITLKTSLMVDGQKVPVSVTQRGVDVLIALPAVQKSVELRTDTPAELEVPANFRGHLQVAMQVEGERAS